MAGTAGRVDGCALRGNPVERRLRDGVLLGVERTDTAPVLQQTSHPGRVAVRLPRRRAVVACAKNPLVAYDHCPDMATLTGRARRHLPGNAQKILIPRWAGCRSIHRV